MRKQVVSALAGALVLAAVLGSGASRASAASDGTVTVVHGIPKLIVDVYVNDKLTLDNFQPGTVTPPLTLPAGTYAIAIRGKDDPSTAKPILTASASVTAGLNATIEAHLDAAGKPTISVFANDVTPVPAGKARLVVRHTAAAPAVDVRANGAVAFAKLTNPNEAKADLPAGTIKADVVLAGTNTVVLGPADLNLREGTATIVYAYGSAADKTLALAVQTIGGLHSAPAGVATGTGGLASDGGFSPTLVLALGLAAMLLLTAGGGLVLARRRA